MKNRIQIESNWEEWKNGDERILCNKYIESANNEIETLS